MASDATEGELSHLESTPIFSPSMHLINVSFKPMLDLDDPSYALSPEPHDDPRNPLRQPKHRNYEGSKEDQEEQRQWLEDIKNSCVIASKEWLDEAKTVMVEPKPDPNRELKSINLLNKYNSSKFGGGLQ
jgi:hypothetical protein